MIDIKNLSYTIGPNKILNNINLQIKSGEFVLLTGESGSGKTTLLKCINGLIPHYANLNGNGIMQGKVYVCGMDTQKHTVRDMSRKIGFVFQDSDHQLFSFDVEEEIAYGLENFGYSRELMENKVKKTLKEYHFESIKENEISTLSEGMKKRLAIASVMVLEPEILILDEPTANLDPKWSNKIITDIAKITRKNNTTTIIVEHELDLLLNKVDRVIVMKNGKIIKDTKDTRSEFAQKEQNAITTNLREFNKLLINSHPASLNYVIMVQKLWYHNILQDINMHISGGFVSIIGPNGAGKTTIIMHFNGLLKPTKGKVLVDGVDTRKSSVASLSRKVGIVFQNPELMFFEDNVEKELSFAPKNIGINAHDIEERVDKIAKQLNLEKLLDRNPFTLSSGEKQRVAIASVLTLEPDIIVLDEPTLGLCPKNKKKLLSIITNLKKEKTVVVVTHDLELVSRSDYIFVINEGRIIASGCKDILNNSSVFEKIGFPIKVPTLKNSCLSDKKKLK